MPYYKNAENKIFWFDEETNQQNLIPIDDEEAKSIVDLQRKKLNEEHYNSLTYQDKRKAEYPSIGDQLDALYHAGVFPPEMAEQIAAVKEKYPKP